MLIERCPNGIEYSYEIYSYRGADYTLYTNNDHTSLMIKEAKKYIKDNFDAVSISIANNSDWDDRYKSEYFSDPRTRNLKWYQIEQDNKLIRQCRIAKMPPSVFVEVHVLPKVIEVEKMNLLMFGDSIYKM